MKLASRLEAIDPFYVMEMAKAARALAEGPDCDPQRGGEPMIYLNIGEPDFTAAAGVVEAASACLKAGRTQYTPSTGLPALRQAISRWYQQRWQLEVAPERILITSGASAALQLITLALVDAGDEVLMPDPSYPCNRQFVNAAEGRAVLLPCDAEQRFQLTLAQVQDHWNERSRGVLLASPSNPTGTSMPAREMGQLYQWVTQQGGITLVDEIYLGLSFDAAYGQTALALDDGVISINSFSKYFNMTGWRLGWLVVPEALLAPIERLAQNLFICASAIAQHAALACFETESLSLYEARREQFKARRDFFVPALQSAGLQVPVMPDGAFYAWADCSALCQRLGLSGSWDLAFELMRRVGVAATPGRDFGQHGTEQHIRFSTASSMAQLEDAAQRLRRLWEGA